MTESATTPFSNRAEILGELWMDYRTDEEFKDFIDYNDLGLPLAYAYAEKIIDQTPLLEQYVNESWELLLEGLGVEDIGFESMSDLFAASGREA
jgi:hypothetical protein